jgi:hypothetical protein
MDFRNWPKAENCCVATFSYTASISVSHSRSASNRRRRATLSKTQINLKLIPGVTGHPEICQLVAINLTDIIVRGSWIGAGPASSGASCERASRGPAGALHPGRPSLPGGPDAALWTRRLRLQQTGFCRALNRKC